VNAASDEHPSTRLKELGRSRSAKANFPKQEVSFDLPSKRKFHVVPHESLLLGERKLFSLHVKK